MLIENQIIKVKWHSQSKEHYINKGYKFTKYRDLFLVKAEDLTPGATARVKVQCDFCGKEYDMAWYHYKESENKGRKNACYNCRHDKRYKNDLSQRQESLYKQTLDACNKKGYILISNKEEIKNNTTYIKFLCPLHGEHEMRINNLINGKGCPICNFEKANKRHQLSTDEVESRINYCNGVLLNKEDYINQYTKNLNIECPWCRKPFTTSLINFTQHGGQACPECESKMSLGERKIKCYLEDNNILFEREKWFSDCRDIKPLPFDFYLPDFQICIEFDGEQHFEDGHFNHSKLDYVQMHDSIKNDYCKNNNIKLVRIPYWDFKNIEFILDNELLILHEDIV